MCSEGTRDEYELGRAGRVQARTQAAPKTQHKRKGKLGSIAPPTLRAQALVGRTRLEWVCFALLLQLAPSNSDEATGCHLALEIAPGDSGEATKDSRRRPGDHPRLKEQKLARRAARAGSPLPPSAAQKRRGSESLQQVFHSAESDRLKPIPAESRREFGRVGLFVP